MDLEDKLSDLEICAPDLKWVVNFKDGFYGLIFNFITDPLLITKIRWLSLGQKSPADDWYLDEVGS